MLPKTRVRTSTPLRLVRPVSSREVEAPDIASASPLKGSNRGPNRILTIDTIRGIAMMLIIFSHTRALIDQSLVSEKAYAALVYFTNISTVSFAFVNGVMLSYFFATGADWWKVYQRFAKRALLLLACHPVIKILSYPAHLDEMGFWSYFWTDFPITDTIAFCLLITPLLARALSFWPRVTYIVLTLLLSPAIVAFYRPTTEVGLIVQQFFFGTLWWSVKDIAFPFPILPWLAIDLCGSFVGQKLAALKKGKVSPQEILSNFKRAAISLIWVAGVLIVLYKGAKWALQGSVRPEWFEVYYPRTTTGLLPAFLAILLVVTALFLYRIDLQGRYNLAAWVPSILGRTSLFSYLTQFVTALSIPALLGFKGALSLTGFFLAVIVNVFVVCLLSYFYGRARGWIMPSDFRILKREGSKVFRESLQMPHYNDEPSRLRKL
jgi:uncharacterized membrane protein